MSISDIQQFTVINTIEATLQYIQIKYCIS